MRGTTQPHGLSGDPRVNEGVGMSKRLVRNVERFMNELGQTLDSFDNIISQLLVEAKKHPRKNHEIIYMLENLSDMLIYVAMHVNYYKRQLALVD